MQTMLNELGFDAGPADGVAGRQTINALNTFRRQHGMAVSHSVDTRSIHALAAAHRRTIEQWQASTGPEELSTDSFASAMEKDSDSQSSQAEPASRPKPKPVSHQASFDCDLATSDVEIAVCDDLTLSTLDGQLSGLYYHEIERLSGDDAKHFKESQRTWLSERNQCGSTRSCLLRSYAKRFGALEDVNAVARSDIH